ALPRSLPAPWRREPRPSEPRSGAAREPAAREPREPRASEPIAGESFRRGDEAIRVTTGAPGPRLTAIRTGLDRCATGLWNISRGARVRGGGFGWSGRQPLSGKARATLSTPRTTREIAKSHQRNPA